MAEEYILTIQSDGQPCARRMSKRWDFFTHLEKILSIRPELVQVYKREEAPLAILSDGDETLPYNRIASLYAGEPVYGEAVVGYIYDSEAEAQDVYNDICEFVDSLEET